jgi:putative nucleotidyltransferase with HDIG domain
LDVDLSSEKKHIIDEMKDAVQDISEEVVAKTDLYIQHMEKKIARYETLMEFNKLITTSMDPRTIQKKSVGKIKKMLNCEYANLFLFDEKTNLLTSLFLDSKGREQEYSCEISEKTFVGSCAHYQALLHITNVSEDIRYSREPQFIKALNCQNIVLVPLVYDGSIVGVLKVINPKSGNFTKEEFDFIEVIISQLTVGIVNSSLFIKLRKQFLQICEALGDAISKKDSYTGGHTKRVSKFAEEIALEMDLSSDEIEDLRLAAILHDVGKIGIADNILKKDSALTDEEFEIMKEHPRLGFEILKHIDGLDNVIDGMRFHHERPDGSGYPYGLTQDETPIIAQIISVADAFDAMISSRPYSKSMPPMDAYNEVIRNAGTQFSTKVVKAFKTSFKKSSMYRKREVEIKKKAS